MKLEVIRKNNKKKIVISTIFLVCLISAISITLTRAKYTSSQSIKIARGTVKIDMYDYKIIAMKKTDDGMNYVDIEDIPTGRYELNNTLSKCTVGGIEDKNIQITFENNSIKFSNITNKRAKCSIYFDRIKDTEDPKISSISASNITKTSFDISVDATDNVGVTEYWYALGSDAYTKGTGNTKSFASLNPGTTYTVKVKVVDAEGNFSESSKSVTTSPDTVSASTTFASIKNNAKTTTPTFTSVATSNEGVYATSDGMYGGTTYYWRGAVTNNYVKFAGFCWRIVRINGDGSMRLIYDGATCHANAANTTESIAISSTAYSSSSNISYYVGWSYFPRQRPNSTSPQTSGTRASIRVTLEDMWYKTNITDKGYDGKVAIGKFCNDRNTGEPAKNWGWREYTTAWVSSGDMFAYAAAGRLGNGTKAPVTSCPAGDEYDLKVGLISADEVAFAGASYTISNTKYYLYNGQTYWTISPSHWSSTSNAFVFSVDSSGYYGGSNVSDTYGVRPVINLRSDTLFATGGNGTQSNPYVVK